MQLGKICTAQADVTSPHIIEIEVDISNKGIPSFIVVGMADKAIDESRERINAALKNCGLTQPKQKKVVVSLSPADLRKEGPAFDLPIALGVLLADEENTIEFNPEGKLFVGELSLDGSLKPIKGALSIVHTASQSGITSVYLPQENAKEASLISDVRVFGVSHIHELLDHLSQERADIKDVSKILKQTTYKPDASHHDGEIDFSYVVEQVAVKRALEIAAAGGHNIAMYGPPGTGKTMLAKAFCSILPPLNSEQKIESTIIHSCGGVLGGNIIDHPPLRAPHHTASYVSVIGGGAYPKPGEVTLAHNGVLFLDEFPEFDKRVLESLREPLEEHVVRISRSKATATFPANFILIAAMNPPSEVYRTGSLISPADERRFKKKISGPIMDRIDIWIQVPKIDHKLLLSKAHNTETSAGILKRVISTRDTQSKRLGTNRLNSSIKPQELSALAKLQPSAEKILNQAATTLDLSPRVYHKIIKLGRTIADLDNSVEILDAHILEALQYRPKEII